MVGGAAGGLWVAVMLVMNPEAVNSSEWLRAILPDAGHPRQAPQTVLEIQAELERRDRFPTTPLLLPSENATTWLLPIATPLPQCQHRQTVTTTPTFNSAVLTERWMGLEVLVSDCQRIVELWLYQPVPQPPGQPARYERLQHIAVDGPPEFRVSDAYRRTASSTGSSDLLPLTHIQSLSDRTAVFSETGQWFTATGLWERGDDRSLYGQLVYYDPQRQRLRASIAWNSPPETLPTWQNVTGDEQLELVVEQTLGLEPAFEIFLLNPADGQLQPVSLLDSASQHPAYQRAIALAQAELWSPALEQMRMAQTEETEAGRWSADAQAQQDAIALHAQVTQTQAQQVWSTPGQQLTAYLLDAQWSRGLEFFEQNIDEHRTEFRSVLAATRFWRRINTAVQVDDDNADITAWAALLLAVRQGQPAAIAWLTNPNPSSQSQSVADTADTAAAIPDRIRRLLNALEAPDRPTSTVSITASPADREPTTVTNAIAPGRILGMASPADLSQWPRQLSPPPTPYRVTLTHVDDGTRWQRSPFQFNASSSDELREALGLAPAASLTLFSWGNPVTVSDLFQPMQTTAEIMTLERQDSQVVIWARGDRAVDYSMAATADAVQPLSPTLLSLRDFQAQNPQLAAILERQLRLTLQQDGFAITEAVPNLFDRLDGTIAWVDLTENDRPDVVLRLSAESLNALYPDVTTAYTLLLSDQGDRLYTATDEDGLVGIVQVEDGIPALVMDTGRDYQLRRWSATAQGFE
jgi:hypothetical protein